MKKQKFSLQLRKQKIAKLAERQAQGGIADTNLPVTTVIPFTLFQATCFTLQINCRSLLINCDPMPTMPSGCGPCQTTHTNTIDAPTFLTC